MSMFPGNARKEVLTPNDKERIEASVASEQSKTYAALKLVRFFEVELTIKIFGQTIFFWHKKPDQNC